MTGRYKNYKIEDFLEDDDFILSIVAPNEESKEYWDSLVCSGSLNIFEYTNAVLLMRGWMKSNPRPSREDLENLWTRIQEGCTAMERRHSARPVKHLFAWLATAAAVVAAAMFIYQGSVKKCSPGCVDADLMVLSQAQKSGHVTLLSDSGSIQLKGSNPTIAYDREGVLQVGKQDASQKEPLPKHNVEKCRVLVPYGKQAKLELSDGTRLWLNAGTTVSYSEKFSGKTRDITVDGEIYAEVAHDGRPFIVHTDDLEITVKGTRFNLSSYTSDSFSQVVLVEGSVDVAHEKNLVSLVPEQAYTCDPEGSSVRLVNTDLYTSWINGVYKFENVPIEQVLLKLARHYNVTLVLPKNPSGVICFGSLELKDDISTLLTGLMRVASFNFVIKNGIYYIQFNEQANY